MLPPPPTSSWAVLPVPWEISTGRGNIQLYILNQHHYTYTHTYMHVSKKIIYGYPMSPTNSYAYTPFWQTRFILTEITKWHERRTLMVMCPSFVGIHNVIVLWWCAPVSSQEVDMRPSKRVYTHNISHIAHLKLNVRHSFFLYINTTRFNIQEVT